MTTANGKSVKFDSVSEWNKVFEWPIELFLLVAHQSKTFEEFKARLFTEGESHYTHAKVAVAAAGVTK